MTQLSFVFDGVRLLVRGDSLWRAAARIRCGAFSLGISRATAVEKFQVAAGAPGLDAMQLSFSYEL
jgi:hypothetical protein